MRRRALPPKVATPSTKRMVADSSRSVNVCRAWDTHSQPARVLSAFWNGAVAVSAFLANCWANVRATKRRKTSLTTMPLTPPDGFRRAVIRPNRNAERIDNGTSALARNPATWHTEANDLTDSNKGNKCSEVMPDGPRAAPRRAIRMFFANRSSSNWTNSSGSNPKIFGGTGSLGRGGRHTGLVNSANVANVPGATTAPSRARLAADNSLKPIVLRARSGLVSGCPSSPLPDRCIFSGFGQLSAFCQ